jgi:hypothetical protein
MAKRKSGILVVYVKVSGKNEDDLNSRTDKVNRAISSVLDNLEEVDETDVSFEEEK